MTAAWTKTNLSTILSRYILEDIFNADEFGLFHQSLPSKTMHFKSQKCCDKKHSEVHLTGQAAGNTFDEERLPIFVIGKSQKPRCFKGVKHLLCRYRTQLKNWMSSELFEEWVHKLDRKFGSDKRKIALIINKCKVHPQVEHLEWVELIFLPHNTTSVTQPMDQGIP